MTVPAGRFPLLLAVALAASLALGGCVTDSKPAPELAATPAPAAKPDDKKPDDKTNSTKPKDDQGKPDDQKPAAAGPPADPGPPLERHEVTGQCWMLADKRGGSMDAKIKLVDQCVDERMKADAARRSGATAR